MDNSSFIETPEYKEAIIKEGEFWGDQSEEVLKYGIPFRVVFRLRTKIQRPKYQGEYEDDPVLFDIVMGKEFKSLMSLIIKHSKKHKTILELGCGPGGLSLELARKGLNVTGIDVSRKSIDIAKRFLRENKYVNNFGSLTYKVEDLNSVVFDPDSNFDVIYSNGGLHHILDFENLMIKAKNALNDEGYFIFYDNIGETKISKALALIAEAFRSWKRTPTLNLLRNIWQSFAGGVKNFFLKQEMEDSELKRLEIMKKSPSPFEGITTSEIMEIIPRHFKIVYKYHCQSFVKIVAHNIYWKHWNNNFTYILVYILKKIDQLLCFFKISKGENVLIVASKR